MTASSEDVLSSLLPGTCVVERTCVAGQAFYQTWGVGTGIPSPNYHPETQAVLVQQCLALWHPIRHLQLFHLVNVALTLQPKHDVCNGSLLRLLHICETIAKGSFWYYGYCCVIECNDTVLSLLHKLVIERT